MNLTCGIHAYQLAPNYTLYNREQWYKRRENICLIHTAVDEKNEHNETSCCAEVRIIVEYLFVTGVISIIMQVRFRASQAVSCCIATGHTWKFTIFASRDFLLCCRSFPHASRALISALEIVEIQEWSVLGVASVALRCFSVIACLAWKHAIKVHKQWFLNIQFIDSVAIWSF